MAAVLQMIFLDPSANDLVNSDFVLILYDLISYIYISPTYF